MLQNTVFFTLEIRSFIDYNAFSFIFGKQVVKEIARWFGLSVLTRETEVVNKQPDIELSGMKTGDLYYFLLLYAILKNYH